MDRAELWHYLESHRSLPTIPTPAELRSRFGEPDEIHVTENTINPEIWGVTEDSFWYARYTPDEKRLEGIPYDEWIYRHGENLDRHIAIILRKDPPSVVGWMWFEDVPEGREQGPPL